VKVLEFRAENVKRVALVEIKPGADPLVQITGRNAQGKSSTLDALDWLFSGGKHIDDDPIRSGQDKAVIEAKLGEYTVRRTLSRSKDGASYTTRLYVEGGSGGTPQDVVNGFMASLSMDPIAFMKDKPQGQFDALRKFVPGVDFDKIDTANQADYEARTVVNREAARLRAAAASLFPRAGDNPEELPAEPIDESALLEQMTGAAQHNADIEVQRSERARIAGNLNGAMQLVQQFRERAAELRRQADEAEATANSHETLAEKLATEIESLPEPPVTIDVQGVRAEIDYARRINEAIGRRQESERFRAQAEQKAWEADCYTDAMAERDEQKREAIAAAKMPVEGLGFGDKVVLFNGHPLSQASGAQQLRISVAIAMAANPKLRVIRIRDGNSLDPDNLQVLREMAEEHDFQVWIERVDTSGTVGFVIEDGRVVHSPAQIGEAA
jgi:ABC-type dipeptide/oligopeptide/nickel transport system ATPase component